MTIKGTITYCFKIWITILISLIVIVPAVEGFNHYFKVVIPAMLFACLFTTPAAVVLFMLLRYFDKAGLLNRYKIRYTILAGVIGFYTSMTCLFIFNSQFNKKSYSEFLIDIHLRLAHMLLLAVTVLCCYFWSYKLSGHKKNHHGHKKDF